MDILSQLMIFLTNVPWTLILGSLALLFSVALLYDNLNALQLKNSLYIGIFGLGCIVWLLTKNISMNIDVFCIFAICAILYVTIGYVLAKKFVRSQITKEKKNFFESSSALTEHCVKKLHANIDAVGDHTKKIVQICFDYLSGTILLMEYKQRIQALTKVPYKVPISQDLTEEIRKELLLQWVVGHGLDFLNSNPKLNNLHSYSKQTVYPNQVGHEEEERHYFSWIKPTLSIENVFSLTRAYTLAWPVAVCAELFKWLPTYYKSLKENVVKDIVNQVEFK